MARRLTCRWGVTVLIAITAQGDEMPARALRRAPDLQYDNYRRPTGPWSIHVVRVSRHSPSFQIRAVHAGGRAVGLSRLSEQSMLLDSAVATPVAAINGDFYQRDGPYAGDPRGLQIMDGELISSPTGGASFWLDALGQPHTTNTASRFEVRWPDGTTNRIDLNGRRDSNQIVLYTPVLGPSTHTVRGRELVLERQGNSPWLPLRPGRTYVARVRDVRDGGNTRILPETMVLSIGPALAGSSPRVQAGAELIISTATSPGLRGVKAAISGGPVLVRDGKRQRLKLPVEDSYEFSSMLERHPRSAIGWNGDYFFLVTVDGRQKHFSVGMTLDELAACLVELGCQEAVNLDGGGSATLWFDGKVQNRPCDGFERPVANSLVVLKKKPRVFEQDGPEKRAGGPSQLTPPEPDSGNP